MTLSPSRPFPVEAARAQFPALADGAIFFDNPGGTQVPDAVIAAAADYWKNRCANTGGAFLTSRRTDETIAGARQAMTDLLGAPDSDTIVFGANMTTLTFHVARSLIETLNPGDEIVLTDLDHDANQAPWRDAEAVGATIRRVPFRTEDGTLEREALAAALRPGKTRLLALPLASNALGTIVDVAQATAWAHAAGALVYVDAVQGVPHLPVDVVALGCDFLVCSAYKFFGPHVGILYGKREHLERLRPHKVRPAADRIPQRWETGTGNFEGLSGVYAAVEYLANLGAGATRRARLLDAMGAIQSYEQGLCRQLLEGLARRSDLKVYGLADPARLTERVPTVALNVAGRAPRALCKDLARQGICCWSGDYYAPAVMERLGLPEGAVRVGLAHYNTAAEVERLLEVL